MKALKFTAIAVLAIMMFSSCTEEKYYPADVYEETWYYDNFEILGRDWKLVGEAGTRGSYFEYIFDKVPLEVSYEIGIVTAYMYFDYKTAFEVQTPLPCKELYSAPNYDIIYTYDVKDDGTIAFKAYISNDRTDVYKPGTKYFRVAIIW